MYIIVYIECCAASQVTDCLQTCDRSIVGCECAHAQRTCSRSNPPPTDSQTSVETTPLTDSQTNVETTLLSTEQSATAAKNDTAPINAPDTVDVSLIGGIVGGVLAFILIVIAVAAGIVIARRRRSDLKHNPDTTMTNTSTPAAEPKPGVNVGVYGSIEGALGNAGAANYDAAPASALYDAVLPRESNYEEATSAFNK